jgi:hypothetical protein
MEGVNCEIGFYERHSAELVKRKYAIATSDDPAAAMDAFPRVELGITAPVEKVPTRGTRSAALRVIAA